MSRGEEPLVDVTAFMRVRDRLTGLHERLDSADLGGDRRGRLRHRLSSIAEGAGADLGRADGLLSRFEAELDRLLGPPAGDD